MNRQFQMKRMTKVIDRFFSSRAQRQQDEACLDHRAFYDERVWSPASTPKQLNCTLRNLQSYSDADGRTQGKILAALHEFKCRGMDVVHKIKPGSNTHHLTFIYRGSVSSTRSRKGLKFSEAWNEDGAKSAKVSYKSAKIFDKKRTRALTKADKWQAEQIIAAELKVPASRMAMVRTVDSITGVIVYRLESSFYMSTNDLIAACRRAVSWLTDQGFLVSTDTRYWPSARLDLGATSERGVTYSIILGRRYARSST